MRSQIEPRHLSLADLLNKRLFYIPDYQRSYSWASRQREDLFQDIRAVHDEGDDAGHFMATIVCLQRDEVHLGTDLFTKLDIVDGQQRLTTLIILLKVISQALDKKNKEQKKLAKELSNLLVKPEGDNLLLLRTNHDPGHYFARYMRCGTAPKPAVGRMIAEKELLSAIQDCKEFTEDWKAEKDLIELVEIIKNRLSFILYEISDEKIVYTVFEVLNSRGLEVAWLDRLKSILMGMAFSVEEANRDELIDELRTIWCDIYMTIGLQQDLSTEALRFAATLYSQNTPSKPLGEREAVDLLRSVAKDAAHIRKIALWLLDVTKACDKLMSNSRQNAVTGIAQARLLAVAIHLRKFKNRDRKDILDLWERVSFRIYGLYGKDARTSVGEYCRLSWDILRSGLSPSDVQNRIRQIGEKFPIKEAIDNCRSTDCYSDWADELRYFFFRYEEHLAEESGLKADSLHWEHIWEKNHHNLLSISNLKAKRPRIPYTRWAT